MTDREYEFFAAELAGLFPDASLTPEESRLWYERVMAFPYQASVDAIKEHRVQSKNRRPILGAFLGLLKINVRTFGLTPSADRFSAVLRRQGVGDDAMSDLAVITEHYRRLWLKLSERNTRDVSESYRKQLFRQCFCALCAEGASIDQANCLAHTIFDVLDVFA